MRRGEKPLIEVTLRKYERPVGLSREEILRKFCMSTGLLQPGDGRELIVDVLDAILKSSEPQNLETIMKNIPKKVAPSGVRRHLRRLIQLKLVERQGKNYRLTEGETLEFALKYLTRKYIVEDILDRIEEYAKALSARP